MDFLPPQEPLLEKAVLGAILVDKKGLSLVKPILLPEDFYDDNHNKVYKSILELDSESKPIDMLSVISQLKKTSRMNAVDSGFLITEMCTKQTSAVNIEHHRTFQYCLICFCLKILKRMDLH